MGAIKDNYYTQEDWICANFARAFSHPARRIMIRTLLNHSTTNIDFAHLLNFRVSTVRDHVFKLIDAGIVTISYLSHGYMISLNEEARDAVKAQLYIHKLLKRAERPEFLR